MKERIGPTLVLSVLLGACNNGMSNGGATPVTFTGPALTMAVLRVVPCPAGEGIAPVVCVQARVTNHGDKGGGSCTLLADFSTGTGDDSVAGPDVRIGQLASGASVTETLAWTSPLPSQDYTFRGLCEPAPRS